MEHDQEYNDSLDNLAFVVICFAAVFGIHHFATFWTAILRTFAYVAAIATGRDEDFGVPVCTAAGWVLGVATPFIAINMTWNIIAQALH